MNNSEQLMKQSKEMRPFKLKLVFQCQLSNIPMLWECVLSVHDIYFHNYGKIFGVFYNHRWPEYPNVYDKYAQRKAELTHWGRDKMAVISQTTNAFSWMKNV